MSIRSWLGNAFTRSVIRTIRKAPRQLRLSLEALEDRTVPSATPLPGTLVWLKADGDATDAVGTSNGQLIDDATFAPGVSGQAFSLDGVNDYVRVPYSSAMQYTAGLSAQAWINPDALPTGSPTGGWEIINQTTESGQPEADFFLMRLMSDGSVACAVHTDGDTWWSDVRSPAGAVVPGRYTHVAVTFDQASGELAVYVNGAKTSHTITGTLSAANTTDLKVGADLWSFTSFQGKIDEVTLLNRPLTQAEVNTLVADGHQFVGSRSADNTEVNLTSVGTSDWVHWSNVIDQKGTGQISNYELIGDYGVYSYFDDPRGVTWTDGSPTLSSTDNHSGIFTAGDGNGFIITAPADTTQRTLGVYVGGVNSNGMLVAHLSDGSSPDYINTTPYVDGQFDYTYTLTYEALSANQKLIVTWTQVSGQNITLNAAALSESNVTVTPAVTVSAANAVYDGAAYDGAITTTVTDGATNINAFGTTTSTFYADALGLIPISAPTNAGTYYVRAFFTSDGQNHGGKTYSDAATAPEPFTISQAAISHTIGNATHAYGSTVDLAATLGATFLTGVNGENLAIVYGSAGNTPTANAGNYAITGVAADGTGLASNYTVTLPPGTLTVTKAILTGNATTQDALNLAKQGKLTITLSNVAGLETGVPLTALVNVEVSYYLTIGTTRYEFVPTTVTTSASKITITYDLKNPALLTSLSAELADNTSAAKAVEAGFLMESLNYTLTDDYLTRLFSTAK